MRDLAPRRATRWLVVAFSVFMLMNMLLVTLLVSRGGSVSDAIRLTAVGQAPGLLHLVDDDSWGPMAAAEQRHNQHPTGDLYDVFFVDHVKFLYPPSALLVLRVLPSAVVANPQLLQEDSYERRLMSAVSAAATIGTILLSIVLFRKAVAWHASTPIATGGHHTRRGDALWVAVFGTAIGLCFYPLIKGHELGQIQVYLGLLVAASLVAIMNGKPVVTGICLGLCCLIKPQFAVVLLWALLSREWRVFVGYAAAAGSGVLLAVYRYGWSAHMSYLRVLRYLSQRGEAYWPNQSVNGLVNRFLRNGSAVKWSDTVYPPYRPGVYYSTLLTSFIFIAVAMVVGRSRRGRSGDPVSGLALAILAATMASPIAWEHHYGLALPILAATAPLIMRMKPVGRATGLLLLTSYMMMAGIVLRPDLLFAGSAVRGLLGSHLLYGALLLFALIAVARRRLDRPTLTLSHV